MAIGVVETASKPVVVDGGAPRPEMRLLVKKAQELDREHPSLWWVWEPDEARAVVERTIEAGVNRSPRRANVERIKRDMDAGKFVPNGETILVTSDGLCIDGLHRLIACAESGVPFIAQTILNAPLAWRESVDQGERRTNYDAWNIQGRGEGGHAKNGIISLLFRMEKYGTALVENRPTLAEATAIRDTLGEKALTEAYHRGLWMTGRRRRGFAMSHWGCWWLLAGWGAYPSEREGFLQAVGTGANLSPGSPALALLSWMATAAALPQTRRFRSGVAFAVQIKAWNAYARGEVMRRLAFSKDEKFPKVL